MSLAKKPKYSFLLSSRGFFGGVVMIAVVMMVAVGGHGLLLLHLLLHFICLGKLVNLVWP